MPARPRPSPRRFRAKAATVVLCTAMAGLLGGLLVLPQSSLMSMGQRFTLAPSELERVGMIQLAPEPDDTCRRLAFDNVTGRFGDIGMKPCSGPLPVRRHEHAFSLIRDGFYKH